MATGTKAQRHGGTKCEFPPPVPASQLGHLTVITGCMFSGKTTELLRRLDRYPPGQVLAFKHECDVRYRPDAIVTHDGASRPAHRVAAAESVPRFLHPGIRAIAFDEAHFFDQTLVDLSRELSAIGVDVLMTALNVNSWGRPFLWVQRLTERADDAVQRTASCARCGLPADRTQRLTPIVDRQMVGGSESYEPRCRTCWTLPPTARTRGATDHPRP